MIMITSKRDGKFAEFWRLNDEAAARVNLWPHWMIDKEQNKMNYEGFDTVAIESPYAGDIEKNVAYAEACMAKELKEGNAPFASHLLYTKVLKDSKPEERERGIAAGIAMAIRCDYRHIYVDRGLSNGMMRALEIYYDDSELWDNTEFKSLGRASWIGMYEIDRRAERFSGELVCRRCGEKLSNHSGLFCRIAGSGSLMFDGPTIDLGSFGYHGATEISK